MAHSTHIATSHRSFFTALGETFSALVQSYVQRRLYRRTLRELDRLGDRELDDLGLHRTSLRSVAYRATYTG